MPWPTSISKLDSGSSRQALKIKRVWYLFNDSAPPLGASWIRETVSYSLQLARPRRKLNKAFAKNAVPGHSGPMKMWAYTWASRVQCGTVQLPGLVQQGHPSCTMRLHLPLDSAANVYKHR